MVLAVQVSRELEEFDVERFRRVGAHLDLMWNVAKVRTGAVRMGSAGLAGTVSQLQLRSEPQLQVLA